MFYSPLTQGEIIEGLQALEIPARIRTKAQSAERKQLIEWYTARYGPQALNKMLLEIAQPPADGKITEHPMMSKQDAILHAQGQANAIEAPMYVLETCHGYIVANYRPGDDFEGCAIVWGPFKIRPTAPRPRNLGRTGSTHRGRVAAQKLNRN